MYAAEENVGTTNLHTIMYSEDLGKDGLFSRLGTGQ
jgi:hypothetical protein